MGRMPVLFIGHGSPINAMDNNKYTKQWRELSARIPKPNAILSISAHWYTNGTKIMNEEQPKTVHDTCIFPQELHEIVYNSPGSPSIAAKSKELITRETLYDNTWGIDTGTWIVLLHMYPNRDVPVFQISIDSNASPEEHYRIGKELQPLREEGVLIFGSGNIVHNIRLVDWDIGNGGFEWANEFDDFIYNNITEKNYSAIVENYEMEKSAKLAVPTPEHFYPLLYTLGASSKNDKVSVYNKICDLRAVTMTSYLWEES